VLTLGFVAGPGRGSQGAAKGDVDGLLLLSEGARSGPALTPLCVDAFVMEQGPAAGPVMGQGQHRGVGHLGGMGGR
jgi:hypothetical protein